MVYHVVRYFPFLCVSFVMTALCCLSMSVAVRICFGVRNGSCSCIWELVRLVQKSPSSSWCPFLMLVAMKYAILACMTAAVSPTFVATMVLKEFVSVIWMSRMVMYVCMDGFVKKWGRAMLSLVGRSATPSYPHVLEEMYDAKLAIVVICCRATFQQFDC